MPPFFRVSVMTSEIGVPLYGFELLTSEAYLLPDPVTPLMVAIIPSDIG